MQSVGQVAMDLVLNQRQFNKDLSNVADKMTKTFKIIKGAALAALGVTTITAIGVVSGACENAYKQQIESERKLFEVMSKRENATKQSVKDILNLADAEQKLGVIGDEVQLAGAQELSTYIEKAESIKKLLPVMNNMLAQQYGYNATQEEAQNIATMMGKVLDGQTGALSRYGYYFDENQEKILKFGNEEQRVAVLTKIVRDSIGDVNQALGDTPIGRQIQLANAWGDVKEQIGYVSAQIRQVLIPVSFALVNVLGRAVSYVRQFMQALGFTAKASKKTSSAINYGGTNIDSYADALDNATSSAKKLRKAMGNVDELHVLSKGSSSDSGNGSGTSGLGDSGGVGGVNDIDFNMGIDGDVEVSSKIQNLVDTIKGYLSTIDFSNLQTAFDNLKKSVMPIIDTIGDGIKWFVTDILAPLGRWTIQDALPAFFNILSGAFKILNQAIKDIKPMFEWLWENILKPVAEWTGGVIVDVLNGIGDALNWISKNEVAMAILEGIALAVGAVAGAIAIYNGVMVVCNVVTGIFSGIMAVLTSPITLVVLAIGALIAIVILLVKHWDKVKEVASNVWKGIVSIWEKVANWFNDNVIEPLKAFFQPLVDWYINLFTSIWNFIKSVFSVIGELAKGCVETIKLVWGAITGWFDEHIIQPIKNFFAPMWNGLIDGAKKAWEGIKNVFSTVATFFKNIFTDAWTKVKNVFSIGGKIFDGIKDGIVNAFKTVVNGIIGGINKVVSIPFEGINKALKKIKDINILGATPFSGLIHTISIPQIPKLAQGAYFPRNNPQLAIVGDNTREGEITTPESKIYEQADKAIKDNQGNGGIVEIHLYHHYEDGKTIIQKINKTQIEAGEVLLYT